MNAHFLYYRVAQQFAFVTTKWKKYAFSNVCVDVFSKYFHQQNKE